MLHYSCGRLAHDSRTWSGRDAIQHFSLNLLCCLMPPRSSYYYGGSISVEWTGGSAARGSWRPGSQLQARSRRPCQRPQNPTPDPCRAPTRAPSPPTLRRSRTYTALPDYAWVPPLHSHASLSSASEGAGEGAGGGKPGNWPPTPRRKASSSSGGRSAASMASTESRRLRCGKLTSLGLGL